MAIRTADSTSKRSTENFKETSFYEGGRGCRAVNSPRLGDESQDGTEKEVKQATAVRLALKRLLCMWNWKKQKARCGQWLSHTATNCNGPCHPDQRLKQRQQRRGGKRQQCEWDIVEKQRDEAKVMWH
jgi:hypothetical protein